MQTIYVIPANANGSDNATTYAPRAQALGATCTFGDPTSGLVTVEPSVVVTSSAIAPVVIADDQGQATLAAIQAAQNAATNAESAAAATVASIQAQIKTDSGLVAAWIAANPNGAQLTAGQTLILARLLHNVFTLLSESLSV